MIDALKKETIDINVLYTFMFGVLLTAIFAALISGFLFSEIHTDTIKPLTFAALFLFMVVCVVSAINARYYYFLLVFVLLAFPSPVNDIFPGIYLGNATERGAAIFPLITHIDIFLLLGIVLNLYRNRFKLFLISSKMPLCVILILALSLAVNLFYGHDVKGNLLLASGTFQLRFLILAILLISSEDITKYQREIIAGIFISVPFLLAEALVNSRLKGYDRLVSGSLSVNTFGNIIASVLVFWVFVLRKSRRFKMYAISGIIACALIVLMTQNRMSFFAIPLTFLLYYVYSGKGIVHKLKMIVLLVGVVISMPFVIDFSEKVLPERFSVKKILSSTKTGNLAEGSLIDVEQSSETSTLFTRMLLFNTSMKMISENPWFGIGAGRWNYVKKQYGFNQDVLIDSHNGILAALSQYGLLVVFFIFFIYIYPIVLFKKIQKKYNHPLSYLAFVNLTMFVCDFTNAGIFKYQVYAFMIFNVVVMMQLYQGSKTENEQSLSA